MPPRSLWLVATLVSLAAAPGLPWAGPVAAQPQERQTPPRSKPSFEGRVEVSEVLLDVLVTDPAGSVVIGLGEDDFEVEEDGEPVDLRSVSFYSNRHLLGGLEEADTPVETPSATEPDVSEHRYFVLFFYRPPLHASGVSRDHFLRLSEAGRRCFEWTVRELLPQDFVAVVAYGTQLELYHEFTRDRQRLADAIHRAALGKPPLPQWTSRAEMPDPEINLAALPEGEELRKQTQGGALDALRVLATALGEIQGRKNLVVFGADLPTESSREWLEGYPPMVEALNTHNVAAYTIGVAGNGLDPSLRKLAEDTGGEYSYRFSSFLDPLRRIAQETSGYYLLSYRSHHPAGESGYQEVTVRTVNPEFHVRSRNGYRYGSPVLLSSRRDE